jgi:hypothetical protein
MRPWLGKDTIMLNRLRAILRHPRTAEDDVAADTAVARTRETGGAPTDDADQATTTGTGTNEEFVGRVSGQDAGDDRESGAEARAQGG